MRLLVETTGAFQLLDDHGGPRKLIRSVGCTLVVKSSFVEHRCAAGQLTVRAQVGDAATDEEWLKFFSSSDGDLDLAVASFVSAFPMDERDSLPTHPGEAEVVRQKRKAAVAPVAPVAPIVPPQKVPPVKR